MKTPLLFGSDFILWWVWYLLVLAEKVEAYVKRGTVNCWTTLKKKKKDSAILWEHPFGYELAPLARASLVQQGYEIMKGSLPWQFHLVRNLSCWRFHGMTSTTSTMDTLVKCEDTSKLINTSSSARVMSHIVPAKCLEIRTWKLVLPTRSENNRGYILRKLVARRVMQCIKQLGLRVLV